MRDTFEPYPIHGGRTESALLADRDVDSNKLLRDRDGGLWIGTHGLGLIHVHDGRTDLFAKSDGLAGNISCSLFEDLDRNIWVATSGGLQRFRELAVKTASAPIGRSMAGTVGGALAMVGPGRWSVDARLFGWRRIEAPPGRRRSNVS